MSRLDHRTLVDRGRKAGLGTSELYRALAAQSAETSEPRFGAADSNGFVVGFEQNGQRVYRPLDQRSQP
jgi:hypothetical protein